MKYFKFIYFVLILFLIRDNIFAISIDSLDFNQKLKKGEKVEKIMTIANNSNETLEYILAIEGTKNIKIDYKKFSLKSKETKRIGFKIVAEREVGDKDFFIIITERKLEKIDGITTNFRYRIKQKYTVVE
jgi:hypothetical protein